jgi:hypothetical protein
MISNERPFPYGRPSPYGFRQPLPPRQPVQETTHKTGQLEIERKTISIDLKENNMGRFVRITEEAAGRRNMVIIPVAGLAEFQKLLDETAQAAKALPPRTSA